MYLSFLTHLQCEGVQDEGLSPHMLAWGVWGLLDVGALTHSPPEVIQGHGGSLLPPAAAPALCIPGRLQEVTQLCKPRRQS